MAYLGVNVETVGVPISQTIHAEQCAITNAWFGAELGSIFVCMCDGLFLFRHHEAADVSKVFVTHAPCGHCRQFMAELPTFERLIVQVEGEEAKPIGSILVDAFRPAALNIDMKKDCVLRGDGGRKVEVEVEGSIPGHLKNVASEMMEKGIKRVW